MSYLALEICHRVRIPSRTITWRTWDQLDAEMKEGVLAAAKRFHCGERNEIPAGLLIVLSAGRSRSTSSSI